LISAVSLLLSLVLILPSFAVKESDKCTISSLVTLVSCAKSSSVILVLISFLILVISAIIDVLIFIS